MLLKIGLNILKNRINTHKAIFLDRDGVIIKDSHLLASISDIVFERAVEDALKALKKAGYLLIVITNQTVISRGLASEKDVEEIHNYINDKLGGVIDKFYYCPHHPNATLVEYRKECECRKPLPGMLVAGAKEFNVDLSLSWMIGDRVSDIIAGKNSGCKTIQVMTGAHVEKPIISSAIPDELPDPDYVSKDLFEASNIILENQ